MKRAILLAAAFIALSAPALAHPMNLTGAAADAFISKHFPNVYIPGDVSGKFAYVHNGRRYAGHAKCNVPAMGARSDGAVSTCSVWY
jgi:hypothetical protein